jgi:hypothetical protein
MRETNHLASCIGSNVILYACATGIHAWSREWETLFDRVFGRCKRQKRQPEKVQPTKGLINSDGRQIGFDLRQERQIHFSQMAILWTKPT